MGCLGPIGGFDTNLGSFAKSSMKAGGHFGFKAFGFVCGLADYLQVSELSSCSFSCHSKRMV